LAHTELPAGPAVQQQRGNLAGRQRRREEKALHLVAVARNEEVQLRRRLHALRDHLQLKRVSERDNR